MQVNFQSLDFDYSIEPTREDMIEAEKDLALARKIYEYIIGKTSRGLIIMVSVSVRQGVCLLRHMLLPPSTHYVVHLSDLANEYGWKRIMRAVGLLLEIFDLPRDSYNANFFREIFRERAKQHRASKLGIVRREVNLLTGKSKLILPDYMGAK